MLTTQERLAVGDYWVTVQRQAAPMCKPVASRGIQCGYPIILMHVEILVERASEDEAQGAAGGSLDFLDSL